MKPITKALFVLVLTGMTLSACGSSSKTTNNVSTTTVGEELASLEKAHAEGLLTEKEYEALRKNILSKK